jgi:probable rRNA maturation factor
VGRRETGSSSLGDIVIAAGVAVRQAREHRHTAGTECRLLALHGLLHLLGYDHEDAADEGRMARAEARLRKKAGLPLSLLGRTTVPPAAPRKRPSASRHPDPGTRRKS